MNVAFITTCRGRLEHVKQSSKLLMADNRVRGHWWFVDSFCPENSGDWVQDTYGNDAHVIKLLELADDDCPVPPFSKPLAQNTGAHHVAEAGYSYLAFVDADTLVTTEMLDFVFDNLTPNSWQFFAPGVRDLSGFLVTHIKPFMEVGGYDRFFDGWGAEDLDLRIRLYCYPDKPSHQLQQHGGRRWTEIPNNLAVGIQHSDRLRGQHYAEQDIRLTNALNMNRLSANFFMRTGLHPADLHGTKLGNDLRRLLDFVDE